jgi:tetratricopeptide (TPR) repeat protein
MIKFNCQHCQRSLKVNQELAGKKARCPGCKQVITIPTLGPPAADVEALAAATLAEQAAAAPTEVRQAGPIRFTCPFCDEEVEVSADLEGKQTPCPECRRIIKVPVRQKTEPKDWRKINPRGPAAGLRRDEPAAPEGAWGTTGSASAVSRQALLEAEAVPTAVEKPSLARRISRGLVVAAVVVLLAAGVLAVLHFREQSIQKRALNQALTFIPEEAGANKLPDVEQAEIHRGAGEYYYRAGQPDKARAHFKQAQARLRPDPESGKPATPGKELLAIELALNQVDLGGTPQEVDAGTRIKWTEIYRDIQPTLMGLASPEARAEALRRVGSRLIQKGQAVHVETLVSYLSSERDRSEMTALIGLELIRAGQRDLAQSLATKALQPFLASGDAGNAAPRPATPPALTALLLILGQVKEAKEALYVTEPKNPDAGDINFETRLGYAVARAYEGNWNEAITFADAKGSPADRLRALLAVAWAAAEKDSEQGRPAIERALTLVDKADPWLLHRLVRLGADLGIAEKVQAVADAIPEPSLRADAQREALRGRLAGKNQADMERMETEVSKEKPNPLVLELLARHNVRFGSGSSVVKAIDAWERESLRPFGYIGVALGLQDSGQ